MALDPVIKQNQRGDIEIKLGDSSFILEPNLKNIDAIESTMQKTFTEISGEIREGKLRMTSSQFAMFVFICQKENNGEKTKFAKIRELIHKHGIVSVIPGVTRFVNTALEGAEEKAPDSDKEPAGNG